MDSPGRGAAAADDAAGYIQVDPAAHAGGVAVGATGASAAPLAAVPLEGISLSQAQRQTIEAGFRAVATDGTVDPEEVEGLAAQLLGSTLNDAILDIVIDMTDDLDAVDVECFVRIMAAILARTTDWGVLKTAASGPVGIGTLVAHEGRRLLKRGFSLNLMVVGESGLGKTTLVNTLFRSAVACDSAAGGADAARAPPKTTEVHTVTHVIEEKGVRLRLSVTDCPGFGDQVDNRAAVAPIVEHVTAQHAKYLMAELAVRRPPVIVDTRVHAVLYFIPPTGHGLRPVDVALMRELHTVANLVPVIAKADAFTVAERDAFKQRVRKDLARHEIRVFPWPLSEDDADDEAAKLDVRERLPFAVVGATDEVTDASGGKRRGRKTPWGFVDVDNPDHCELPLLRDALIRVYFADLKESTSQVHYELYREQHLDIPAQ